MKQSLPERIIELLKKDSGLTDREITDALIGISAQQQPINQACRTLERKKIVVRRKRHDDHIGNYLIGENVDAIDTPFIKEIISDKGRLSEDIVKSFLEKWLTEQKWRVQVAWRHSHGADIEALTDDNRWIIEVKGEGSLPPMRVNYFISVIGEVLQRMDDPETKYSIAFPDMKQYRNLWQRLPKLAKSRTELSVLFIDELGNVSQEY